MIELNTLEDLENAFPDEISARKFFFEIRWGKFASCPYCGNNKCWFAKDRYKCAGCRLLFSETVKTMLEGTKLKTAEWVKIFFLYAKSRGRISSFELAAGAKISHKTEFFVKEKLDFIWANITRDIKPTAEIMKDMVTGSIALYTRFSEIKEQPYYKNPFHLAESDIYDISIQSQWNLLIRYTRYFINVYCRDWIFIDFASPEDILSEVFLHFKKEGIKDYNTTIVLKTIWKISSRMWGQYLKEHPKYHDYVRQKNKNNKEKMRRELKESYVVDLIMNSKDGVGKRRSEVVSDKKIINEKRNKLKIKRNRAGKVNDFISHFD